MQQLIKYFIYINHINNKILKEELKKQYFVIQNDRHPFYKKENFQVKIFLDLINTSNLN